MHLCPEPASDHPTHGGAAQSAPRGYRQNVSQRERLCCVWEVQTGLQYPHPILSLSFHSHLHHSVCPALSHHSNAQVRAAFNFAGGLHTQSCQSTRSRTGVWCTEEDRSEVLEKHSAVCLADLGEVSFPGRKERGRL